MRFSDANKTDLRHLSAPVSISTMPLLSAEFQNWWKSHYEKYSLKHINKRSYEKLLGDSPWIDISNSLAKEQLDFESCGRYTLHLFTVNPSKQYWDLSSSIRTAQAGGNHPPPQMIQMKTRMYTNRLLTSFSLLFNDVGYCWHCTNLLKI